MGKGEPQKKRLGRHRKSRGLGILPEARRGPPKKTTEKLGELTQCWEAELAYESQRESF